MCPPTTTAPFGAHRTSHRPGPTAAVRLGVVALTTLLAVLGASAGIAADRPSSQPPSVQTLERRALDQQFTAAHLLGNDAVGIPGIPVVVARIARAWEAAKRMYLGHPQNPTKARALREVFDRWQRRDDQLHGDSKRDGWRIANVRQRLLAPSVRWPGESDRQHRIRVATVLAADRASSRDFWLQIRKAKNREPSEDVKTICGVITLGPTVLGAIGSALRLGGTKQATAIRDACNQTGKRVQDTTEAVAAAVKDPLGTLAKGIFGPLLKELQKATAYASKQVGAAIDKVATPDLSQQWVRRMLRRAATIAVLIALVAGILGIAHAAITANLSALASVAARALLSGVVGSVVLTMLNVALIFVDQLTAIALGAKSGSTGKRFSTFADTATTAMARAEVPSFVALLLLLVLLLGLVVVWWEMWLRAPFLYAVAFFYGPAYSASLFPPARQVLSQLNALLAAVVLMPLVVLSLLELAVMSMQGEETITAVLQAAGLVLLAAASPAILVALFSPSVALSAAAGMAGALGTGRSISRTGRRAASASLSAAGFATDRLGTRPPRGSAGPGPSGGATPPPGGTPPAAPSAGPGAPATGPPDSGTPSRPSGTAPPRPGPSPRPGTGPHGGGTTDRATGPGARGPRAAPGLGGSAAAASAAQGRPGQSRLPGFDSGQSTPPGPQAGGSAGAGGRSPVQPPGGLDSPSAPGGPPGPSRPHPSAPGAWSDSAGPRPPAAGGPRRRQPPPEPPPPEPSSPPSSTPPPRPPSGGGLTPPTPEREEPPDV